MSEIHVIKVGGAAGIDYDKVCDDVARLWDDGERVVLVHGGSAELNEISTKLGHPPRFVTSPSGHESRVTDRETLAIFEMVYCGKQNKGIVERLQRRGVQAVGLSGLDGRIFEGRRKDKIRYVDGPKTKVLRNDYTGKVEKVNKDLVTLLLDNGYLPVLTPPACSYEGDAINVDGDRASAELAVALRAQTLLLLSNVPGLLEDLEDPTSLVEHVPLSEMEGAMAFAGGRMKKKLLGAREAVEKGVVRVILGDANRDQPVQDALAGMGTVVGAAIGLPPGAVDV